jgi:SNF2 family DNA or RNA helicase
MRWFPRADSEKEVRRRVDRATYFIKREDAIDLPERKYVNIDVELSEEHRKLYDQVESDFFAAVDGYDEFGNELSGHARVTHEATMRIKLLQITSGFVTVVDDYGKPQRISLPWNAKLDKLNEIVKEHLTADKSNNVIVWCCFRWEVEKIYSTYKDIAVFVYGGMSKDKRDTALNKWLNDSECRMMISIPASTKFGHTWLKANASIYFSGTEDFQNYSQSRDRNYRRGQTREVTEYKLISKDTVEKRIWIAISNKKKLDKFLKDYAIERNAQKRLSQQSTQG